MQKDYWNIAKRNFRAMGIVSVLFVIIFALGIIDQTNSTAIRNSLLLVEGFFVLTVILFFVTSSLFKKHSPKAITVGYSYLGVALIFSLVNDFIINSPSNFTIYKVMSYIVIGYLFNNVYRASKQDINQSN